MKIREKHHLNTEEIQIKKKEKHLECVNKATHPLGHCIWDGLKKKKIPKEGSLFFEFCNDVIFVE